MVTPADTPDRGGDTPPPDSAVSASRTAPTTPKNAATVVVMRPSPEGAQVYMLRRSAKSPFMPSTLVFPGGRLDPADGLPADPAAWERAAVRECREEAGLDLGDRGCIWFDTWLTPSAESRRRYLARFYLVVLNAGDGEEARADGHETHAGRWATAAQHLAAWDAAEVDLPPPTLCILLQLQRWTPAPAREDGSEPATRACQAIARQARAQAQHDPILPKVTTLDGRPVIVMPHDPQYPHLPGQAMIAPARATALPQRFERSRDGWRPQ